MGLFEPDGSRSQSDRRITLLTSRITMEPRIDYGAYCVDMHTKVARSLGETEQRLYEVSLWRETPFYTERERAAFAWTEAVTLVHVDHIPDDVYETVRQHFDDKQLVDLTAAIVAINGWNRLAIAFRTVPGTFQPGRPVAGDRDAYAAPSDRQAGDR